MVTRTNLADVDRRRLKDFLLERLEDGVLTRGAIRDGAVLVGVTHCTVSRLWRKWKVAHENALNGVWDVTTGKKANGRPVKYPREGFVQAVRELPYRSRGTVRLIEGAIGVSATTIHRLIHKEKLLKPHTSNGKPMLTEVNKMARLEFCLNERGNNGMYNTMYDRVHLDEKWFFLTRVTERYYLADDEPRPHRVIGHKCHIPKCMHLAANARPHWDAQRNQWFDGKLGLFPIAEQVAAQRSSRNRPRGTLEWKSVSLTKVVYGNFLFEKVVPSILRLWPRGGERRIQLQHDNATPHLTTEEFQTRWLEEKDELQNIHGGGLDWEISLYCQPANSPDMNVNDLCFFASIQSLQYHHPSHNLDAMITRLAAVYEAYPRAKLNNSFLTLQSCMNEVIECNGGCDYKIQHMNKARLERLGLLPQSLFVTDAAMDWDDNGDEEDDDDDEDEDEQEQPEG
jgi:hypothetical protein